MTGVRWSLEEEAILRESYLIDYGRTCKTLLPQRTLGTIRKKAQSMNITTPKGSWMKGKTKEDYPALSNAGRRKGYTSKLKGKTYEEIFGEEKAKEIKEKMSASLREYYKTHDSHQKDKSLPLNHPLWNYMFKKGETSWCRGLTKETDPRIKRRAESIIGHKVSEESRRKMSESHKKRWKELPDEERQKQIEKRRQNRAKQKFPNKDSSIEKSIQNELKLLGLSFETHISLLNICFPDILFPEKNTVVFLDGDYWHSKEFNNGKTWKRDKRINKKLRENGWTVLRFWEHEINDNKKTVINKIVKVINYEPE